MLTKILMNVKEQRCNAFITVITNILATPALNNRCCYIGLSRECHRVHPALQVHMAGRKGNITDTYKTSTTPTQDWQDTSQLGLPTTEFPLIASHH